MNGLKTVVKCSVVLVVFIMLLLSGCSSNLSKKPANQKLEETITGVSDIELLEAQIAALNESLEVQGQLLFELNRKITESVEGNGIKTYEVNEDQLSAIEDRLFSDITSIERKVSKFEGSISRIQNLEMELSIIRMYIDKDVNIHELIGFITVTDVDTKTIGFDDVEWVSMEDTDRINALGMNAEEDFPNGFNLFNDYEVFETLAIDETVEVYTLVNPSTYNRVYIDELTEFLGSYSEKKMFCTLVMDGEKVVAIIETYIP